MWIRGLAGDDVSRDVARARARGMNEHARCTDTNAAKELLIRVRARAGARASTPAGEAPSTPLAR